MKAYLIDPWACTITEVEHDGDFRQIYAYLSRGADLTAEPNPVEVDCFDVIRLNSIGEAAYVDDTGRYRSEQAHWKLATYPEPLTGRALVLGSNHAGESVAPTFPLWALVECVEFVELPRDEWPKPNMTYQTFDSAEAMFKALGTGA